MLHKNWSHFKSTLYRVNQYETASKNGENVSTLNDFNLVQFFSYTNETIQIHSEATELINSFKKLMSLKIYEKV